MDKKLFLASKNLLVIITVFVTSLLVSNLTAGKIVIVAKISLPAAVIVFPVTYILGDILTEVYGFPMARFVILLGFVCNLFAVAIYTITVALPHPDFWINQEAYSKVLLSTPRVLFASMAGYLFGAFSNSIILSKLKIEMQGRKLWVRTIFSSVVGEAVDTFLFIFIAFFGIVTNDILFQMFFFQYIWKLGCEIFLTPILCFFTMWLKRKENIDTHATEHRFL